MNCTHGEKFGTYWNTVVVLQAAQADAAVEVSVGMLSLHREKERGEPSHV